jgi:hypothetical protein
MRSFPLDSKILIYINGHFYEKETGHRLEIQPGAEISITANVGTFCQAKTVGSSITVRDSVTQVNEISRDPDIKYFKKALNRGTMLYVSISIHEFRIELLEDLYFYLTSNSKDQEKGEGRLYDCACVARQNTTRSVQFFEEIFGKSLNETYKRIFVHFFGNNGNPSCNAIDRFYEQPGNEKLTLINRYRNFSEEERNPSNK